MTVIEFLTLIELHPFILYYYAFSMMLSIILGHFFLSRMGHPGIWNYFFSFLLYMMSVIGMVSVIVFGFQLISGDFTLPWYEVLIPFFTMMMAIIIIRNQVNISLLTGFGHSRAFFGGLFLLLFLLFVAHNLGWWSVLSWPLYLFLLLLVVITLILRRFIGYIFIGNEQGK